MTDKKIISILQAVLLLCDETSEYELLTKYDYGPYLKKAREIKKIIER